MKSVIKIGDDLEVRVSDRVLELVDAITDLLKVAGSAFRRVEKNRIPAGKSVTFSYPSYVAIVTSYGGGRYGITFEDAAGRVIESVKIVDTGRHYVLEHRGREFELNTVCLSVAVELAADVVGVTGEVYSQSRST